MSINLVDYLNKLKKDVKSALGADAELSKELVVEITVTTQSKAGAGFDFQVIQAGADIRSEATQKVTIPIKFITELDKARVDADIAEARKRERNANYKIPTLGGL